MPQPTDQLLNRYDEVLAFVARLKAFSRGHLDIRSISFFWRFRKHHRFEKQRRRQRFIVWERVAVDNRRWNQRVAHLRWKKEQGGQRASEFRLFIRSQGSEFRLHGHAMAVKSRFPDVRFGDMAEVHKLFLERAKRDPYTTAFTFFRAIATGLLGVAFFQRFPGAFTQKWIPALLSLAISTVIVQAAVMLIAAISTFLKSGRLAWAGDVINYLALLEAIEDREFSKGGTP